MKKDKGKFFVSNQGGLVPEEKPSFRGAKLNPQRPIWEDVGGAMEVCQSDCSPEADPGTLEEIKGGERLW